MIKWHYIEGVQCSVEVSKILTLPWIIDSFCAPAAMTTIFHIITHMHTHSHTHIHTREPWLRHCLVLKIH